MLYGIIKLKLTDADLYNDGMVTLKNLNTSMTGSGMVAKRTTAIADEFLKFILEKDEIED